MAFALRKMFSIPYFSKTSENSTSEVKSFEYENKTENQPSGPPASLNFQHNEPDSTSVTCSNLDLPNSLKAFTTKKGSLSDTDLLSIKKNAPNKNRRNKNLKLDIKKASQSMNECLSRSDNTCHIENTPKHVLLDCKSADLFSNRLMRMNFSQSFEFEVESDTSEENIDIELVSECSESDVSGKNDDKSEIKMCRKVPDNIVMPSVTPESFADVELEINEDERTSLLLNYEMRFEKLESIFKKLLNEFQFHIEVSKIFNGRSIVTPIPESNIVNKQKYLKSVCVDDARSVSPTDCWNVIMENEDVDTKLKLQNQLLALRNNIDNFISNYLQISKTKVTKMKRYQKRSITFDLHKGKRMHKLAKLSEKKRLKHLDFPDLRETFLNLFQCDDEGKGNVTVLDNTENDVPPTCHCQCHNQSLNQTDSGLTSKTDNLSNQSISSSIGNFCLDSTTLSAYSESLDQVISYNSFQDTSLMNTLLQKPAIERITFYVQVHSIQLRSETVDCYESKNTIKFFCPACDMTEVDENGVLKHILGQKHCEKIHFLYKTAYIKKCMSSGKEIQPSTVLNPMTMYRDVNKIVCFGDATYACSLCFENLIVGESILMTHCMEIDHMERRDKLDEILG